MSVVEFKPLILGLRFKCSTTVLLVHYLSLSLNKVKICDLHNLVCLNFETLKKNCESKFEITWGDVLMCCKNAQKLSFPNNCRVRGMIENISFCSLSSIWPPPKNAKSLKINLLGDLILSFYLRFFKKIFFGRRQFGRWGRDVNARNSNTLLKIFQLMLLTFVLLIRIN